MSPIWDPLVIQGLQLMLAGMGTVFAFLTLLVFAVKLMTWSVEKITPDDEVQSQISTGVKVVPPAHVAAVSAAIKEHRSR